MKALEKDRARRYETANALARDIQRHLEHKPVLARPPTPAIPPAEVRPPPPARRSVLATAVVALVVGVTGIMRERDRSTREEGQGAGDQQLPRGPAQVRRPMAGRRAADDGGGRARGGVKQGRCRQDRRSGRRRLGPAHDRDRLSGPRPARRGRDALPGGPAGAPRSGRPRERGDRRELERPGDHAHLPGETRLGRSRPRAGAGDPPRARRGGHRHGRDPARSLRPGQHEGRGRPGHSLAHEALAIIRRVAGERDLAVATAMARVQSTQLGAGELAKAESTGRAAAAMLRELGLERHPQMVPILSDLSITLANRGELTEALAVAHQTVALDSRLFGTAHPYLATHLENLGYVYDHAGFGDSAKMMVEQVLAMRRALLGTTTPPSAGPCSTSRRWSTTWGRTPRPSRCTRRRCSGCGGPTGRSTPTSSSRPGGWGGTQSTSAAGPTRSEIFGGPDGDRPAWRALADGYGALRPVPGDDAGGPAAVEGGRAARAQGLRDPGQPEGHAGPGNGGPSFDHLWRTGRSDRRPGTAGWRTRGPDVRA